MSLTLYQLKAFVTVAKFKSFTLAAEALRVRQPSATLIVQSLERELEVKLFQRLGNKIQLTNAGEELLREAELIVTRAEGLKERIEEVKGLRKGRVRVGGSALPSSSFLPVAVQHFKAKYPGVDVVLGVDRSSGLQKKLLTGDLDLAVLSGDPPQNHALLREPLYKEEVIAIASPSHPLTKKRSVPLETIAKEPLLCHEKGTYVRDALEHIFSQKKLPLVPALEVIMQAGSRDAIKQVAISGLGIAFFPKCHVTSDLEAGRLKIIRAPELQISRNMYLVTHKGKEQSSIAETFKQFLKNYVLATR